MTVTAVDITSHAVRPPAGPLAEASPVWVEARPNLRRAYVLAGDILAALGKRRDLAGKGRNQHEDITLAAAWLRARRTQHLVIIDAQRLHSKILGTLCQLAAQAGVDLWLLHRPPSSDVFAHALERRSDTTKDYADVPPPVLATDSVRAAAPFPPVPRHDLHLFRAACAQRLPARDLSTVLARLDQTAARAYAHLIQHGADADAIRYLVDEVLDQVPDDNRLIADVRGLQIAAWHHDVFVKVDLEVLLNSEERPTVPRAELDRALNVYRQPHRILTGGLTRLGHSLHAITGLQLADVTNDGYTLAIGGDLIDLSPTLAQAARVAVLLRRHDAAADTDPLLPYAEQTLVAVLTDATNDIGLHVKGRRAERTRPKHTAHLRSLGITLARLP